MHIAIVAQYFWPESVGPGTFLRQLADDLVRRGHKVTVVTAFPNYPEGKVAKEYRGRFFQREKLDSIHIIRTWIYASESKRFWSRVLNFGSFCASAFFGGLALARPDVIYCYIPPLPLGVTADLICRFKGARLVPNVQDIHPEVAVKLGYLRNPRAIRWFEKMERYIYRRAAAIVAISDQFRRNLEAKGVPAEKIHVVPNWADASEIQPGPRDNDFRRELGIGDAFTIIYSGTLSHNSALPGVLDAAALLRDEPYQFVIVGEGVYKPEMQRAAQERGLTNVRFLPFQPWDKYPQVLNAADLQLVSLQAAAGQLSMPSKILKIMAAGRAVLAQAVPESDVAAILRSADCGVAVHPDDPAPFADAVRALSRQPERVAAMGANARRYFLDHFERQRCTSQIEAILRSTSAED
jgi:colanic acid biosynthesis glycosyl transferase WcaI